MRRSRIELSGTVASRTVDARVEDCSLDEIRAEAFRIFETHVIDGLNSCPQDDWLEAQSVVRARQAHQDARRQEDAS